MAESAPLKGFLKDQRSIPIIVFLLLVALYVLSSQMIEKDPRIDSITPEVGQPGKVLIISGEHFGRERNGSEVIFAGMRPHSNSYLEWSDTRISVRIPEDVGSGRLYINKGGEKSNALLFSNSENIPKQLSGPAAPGMPYIEALEPAAGSIGSLVRIRGLNFSAEQGSGQVYFASTVEENDAGMMIADGISCTQADFDYESWGDQELLVRVPDGATSGSIRVATDRGVSNAIYFEVSGMPGDRLLPDKRGYQVNFVVEVDNVDASPENALNLWIPNVYEGGSQTNIEAVRDPAPLWEDFNGVARYRLQEIEPWRRYTVSVTYWLDRTALETRINPARVPVDYDRERKLYKVFTSPDSIVPSADDRIISIARRTAGNEKNPYLRARALYRMVLRDFAPSDEGNAEIGGFIDGRQGDAYDYSLLYTALLRSLQVPARVLSGSYLFADGSSAFHYWTEFYIKGFGWVPADPYLGDEGYEDYSEIENPGEYYFGSVDNRRIVFSRGIVEIRPTDPKSILRVKNRVYSLQTIHEEAVGNIASYQSRWLPLKVIDRW